MPPPPLRKVLKAADIQLLAWHFCDGLTFASLGRMLRRNPSSVFERIQVAVKKLRKAGYPPPHRLAQSRRGRKIVISGELLSAVAHRAIGTLLIMDLAHPEKEES